MPRMPILTEKKERQVAGLALPAQQAQTFLPSALEHRVDPPGLDQEFAALRALIRTHGKSRATVEILVTKKMADAMLHLRNKKNRKINRAWVEKLKVILLGGRFHGDIARAIFDWDGDLRDAQHRLMAISETAVAVEMDVTFGIDPAAFPAMDVGLRRTAAQNLDLDGIRYGGVRASIVRLQYRIEHSGSMPDDEYVYLQASESSDDVMHRALLQASRLRAKKKVIHSSAALAYRLIALHSTWASLLDEFWDRLVIGDDLQGSNPIFQLREHFDRKRDDKDRKGHQFLTQTRHAAWIIQAWDAWVRSDTRRIQFKWDDPNGLPAVV